MRKFILLVVLLALFSLCFSVPANCNGGSSGNAVLEANDQEAEVEFFKFRRPAKPAFQPNPFAQRRAAPVAQPQRFARGARGVIQRIGHRIREGIKRTNKKLKQVGENIRDALRKLLGREPTQKDIDDYRNGNAEADNKAQAEIAKAAGARSTTGGKFVFAELTKEQTDKCLGKFFFCNVDCAADFNMKCKVEAKIYSVFVPRQQHVDICVADRAANPIPELKNRPEYREECLLRPCACKKYEQWFVSEYGAKEFNEGMKMIQQQCLNWCTSGVKPAGVIDGKTATKAISRNKNALLRGFGHIARWLGDFLAFGKKLAKAIGKALGKAAKAVGKVVGKAARAVGKAAKAVGKAVGRAARAIGRGFRRIGGGIRRFFRRRW